MIWIVAILMAAVGFGYVTVRRNRKKQQPMKRAA